MEQIKETGKNFWLGLKRPFFTLAPMEDVTDTVFRRLIGEIAPADVYFTEFTNVEGVQHLTARDKIIHRLKYYEVERPVVAQIWGVTPEDYYETARYIAELGFDGIDINMGCPVKKIIKKGACSALIKNPTLAQEIMEAVQRGVDGQIPVSVKTRIGFDKIATEEWCGFLLRECRPAVLSVHGRTVREMSKVANHWDEIGKVAALRDELSPETLVMGNGDVTSYAQGVELAEQYKLDGIMIGRGVFTNPWIFDRTVDPESKTAEERLALLRKHVEMFEEEWGDIKNFAMLKRFFKIYLNGFDGAKAIRVKFMDCSNYQDVYDALDIGN